ncbi:MAG: Hsp20/alpha crystallin family protein [Chloroflexi bacterium]|nr:Hsp20/alpha crystallin family protein [Chloroflexota bacterium]
MSIARWDPFRELATMREAVDRLFEESFLRPHRHWDGGMTGVPLDMYQTADDVVVKAALPGVRPEDVDISIMGDTLTIRGETNAQEEVKREDYLYQEHRYGAFSRTVNLPGALNTDKAEAIFENGVLTLTIPKAEEAKPKSIKVQVKGAIEGKKM